MTDQNLTLIAVAGIVGLVLFGGSILAWVRFWQASGEQKQRTESAMSLAISAQTSVEMLKTEFSNFKTQIAFDVIPNMLTKHEKRIADMIESVRDDLKEFKQDIRDMHGRIDREQRSRKESNES